MSRIRPGRGYSLVMKDGSRKEFRAIDVSNALSLARAILPVGSAASLCEEGKFVAEVTYSAEGYLAVSNPPDGRC